MQQLLLVTDLHKHFRTAQGLVRAVDGVTFALQPGETLGLVGESGSGKSTIAYTVIGIHSATRGEVRFNDADISRGFARRSSRIKREIQIVFQDPGSSLNPRQSVRSIIEMPLRVHGLGRRKQRLAAVRNLIEGVGLPVDYLRKYPSSIGGGEKQMVGIARALATDPSLLVLDEPTSALDVSMQARILNLLIEMQKDRKLTYLFITHDLAIMRNMATRIAILYLGKLCEVAPGEQFFQNPLHPYTQMLLSSIPVISPEEELLKPERVESRGEIPSPVDIPTGCGFHPRCFRALPICSETDPTVCRHSTGRSVRCHLYKEGPLAEAEIPGEADSRRSGA